MKMPNYIRSKFLMLLAAGLGGLFTIVNLAFAQSWTATSAPNGPWLVVRALKRAKSRAPFAPQPFLDCIARRPIAM
jgi:hypothetical protein